ncbi:MAG: hypothetical protein DRN37_09965 [Thermoplasmata archaeon]|nr:MAG: hypothetical protein B1H13_05675 [Desulfobacteraceae bacterium 4484_190.3]RLB15850.1 MAG: hypothetical protein DRG82_10625 [Deltaproteobacteria bacterium]RLF54652.1 MAG: hypothetical protein DRN37_09965 [Thermoplasmata archaeon]
MTTLRGCGELKETSWFEAVSKSSSLVEVKMIIGGGGAGVKRLEANWVKCRRLSDGKKRSGILWWQND